MKRVQPEFRACPVQALPMPQMCSERLEYAGRLKNIEPAAEGGFPAPGIIPGEQKPSPEDDNKSIWDYFK